MDSNLPKDSAEWGQDDVARLGTELLFPTLLGIFESNWVSGFCQVMIATTVDVTEFPGIAPTKPRHLFLGTRCR